MLSSAMPHSGGDYVFQSRLLRGDVGFTLTFGGLAIWQTFFAYLAGNTIASGILPPIFEIIGYSLNNKALIDAGITLSDPWNATIVTIVIIWLSALILLRGMKAYAYLQNYFMIPASFVALAIMVGLFLIVPRETFVANFNSFQNTLAPNPDWYNTIISKAKEFGYDPSPRFSWYDTLGYAALMYALYMWCMWSAELLGEIKSVEKIKNAWLMMSGATVLEFITCIIGIGWATDYMGSEFVKSLGYLASSHPEALVFPGFT